MSDMPDLTLPTTAEPLRDAIRRLRWFRQALDRQLADVTRDTGVSFTVDDRKLARVFVVWLREIEAQKPQSADQRRAYFDFVSGLMLRDLLREMPVKAGPVPLDADAERAEYFWPEGFAMTVFCLNVRAAIVAQEFDADTQLAPDFFQIRLWWSFRENVAQDAGSAIGFFDVFIGQNPEWQMPDSFRQRLQNALSAPPADARLARG